MKHKRDFPEINFWQNVDSTSAILILLRKKALETTSAEIWGGGHSSVGAYMLICRRSKDPPSKPPAQCAQVSGDVKDQSLPWDSERAGASLSWQSGRTIRLIQWKAISYVPLSCRRDAKNVCSLKSMIQPSLNQSKFYSLLWRWEKWCHYLNFIAKLSIWIPSMENNRSLHSVTDRQELQLWA